MGVRKVPFTRSLLIEREDFAEVPPKKWKRLAPGEAVRLRGGYVVRCEEVIRDAQGEIVELQASFDPATKGANPTDYKPNGVIHWVSAEQSVACEVRAYDRLFTEANPDGDKERDFHQFINPESLTLFPHARAEIGLKHAAVESRYQFERQGYFCVDPDSTEEQLVFNKTVGLRDSWAKIQSK